MKVEVWSDFVCPFCYIGKRQLEKAIRDLGYAGQVEVELKSFLLDPTINVNTNMYTFACLRMYKITRFLSLNDSLIDKNLQR